MGNIRLAPTALRGGKGDPVHETGTDGKTLRARKKKFFAAMSPIKAFARTCSVEQPNPGAERRMASAEIRQQFESVVRTHAAELYRYAYWLSRDRHQAEDTIQEAMLRGWVSFASVRDEKSVRSWLYTIVRNEFYRHAERHGARPQCVDIEDIEIADTRTSIFGLDMRDALMALPTSHAEPLALQLLGGFTCAEIATMLATTEGAVMTRLTRARQALRRLLAPAPPSVLGRRGSAS